MSTAIAAVATAIHSKVDDEPVIGFEKTIAQNADVETILKRIKQGDIFIPRYQRDSNEWDDIKKSLFLESILHWLTVPAFYLAPCEADKSRNEVVDGQQRLMTLYDFWTNEFQLSSEGKCPYFANSNSYAGSSFKDLSERWRKAFEQYNLTLVYLPAEMPLNLRLEVFRRINDGGTPLSAQDIRLSYYCESPSVQFIQRVGVYDPERTGAKRMLAQNPWPWSSRGGAGAMWQSWWTNTTTSRGQAPSEMFLWFVVSEYRKNVDKLLEDKAALSKQLNLRFRDRNVEVLDIVCAQFRYEDVFPSKHRLLPTEQDIARSLFPRFAEWWHAMRRHCVSKATPQKYRAIALLIPGLFRCFKSPELSDKQWEWVGQFVANTRDTADELGIEFPESKGRWNGSQRTQLDAYDRVAFAISEKTGQGKKPTSVRRATAGTRR